MYPLQHSFEEGQTLLRIQIPDSVTFLRPVDGPSFVKNNRAGVAEPLCFRQIGFAASECLFRLFSLGDVAPHAAVADKTAGLVKDRQPGHRYIALAAIRGRSRKLEIAKWQVGIEGVAVLPPGLSVRLE